MKKKHEIEQKYRIRSAPVFRGRLKRLGAEKLWARDEANLVFDCRGELRRASSLLRLRHYGGRQAFLTFKGPLLRSSFKKRFEAETPVDRHATLQILLSLGYRPVASYRKKREEYRLQGAVITLDYLKSIGWFAEIEGSPGKIRSLQKRLQLEDSEREERNYLEIALSGKKVKPS